MSDQSCCNRCCFYRAFSEKHGDCRRYPPVRYGDGDCDFPAVSRDEMCGEFRDRETLLGCDVTPSHVIGRLQERIRELEGEATRERLRGMFKGNTEVTNG